MVARLLHFLRWAAPATVFALLAIVFIALNALNDLLFDGVHWDLTENRLYTLSDGSRGVINTISEPIDLYFFFSDEATRTIAPIRNYSRRVRELLEEYESYADGKIRLHFIDPEPFSVAEDRATQYGLQAVPSGVGAATFYLGLAGVNSVDTQESIPFFHPQKERFLEYDITQLIDRLSQTQRPVVGLYNGLGDEVFDRLTIKQNIERTYTIETISSQTTEIPDYIALLVVIHPTNLSDNLLYAIDQYALKGKAILLFADPMSNLLRESVLQNAASDPQSMFQQAQSNPHKLLNAWGVNMRDGVVLSDNLRAITVNTNSGAAMRHPAFINLHSSDFSDTDIVTSGLDRINLGAVGVIDLLESTENITIEPLLRSSHEGKTIPTQQMLGMQDTAQIMRAATGDGKNLSIGVRISGEVNTAFAERSEENHTAKGRINVIFIADTDILSDEFWVRSQNFFGQRIVSAWADNGNLVMNILDNLIGSSNLISIRSRGRFTRPFTTVDSLRVNAEQHYKQEAEALETRLRETEQQLTQLQQARRERKQLTISVAEQNTINRFQQDKLNTRKQLRNVRHQLNKDIENLGALLKIINIVVAPLLLTFLLWLIYYWSARRMMKEQ